MKPQHYLNSDSQCSIIICPPSLGLVGEGVRRSRGHLYVWYVTESNFYLFLGMATLNMPNFLNSVWKITTKIDAIVLIPAPDWLKDLWNSKNVAEMQFESVFECRMIPGFAKLNLEVYQRQQELKTAQHDNQS